MNKYDKNDELDRQIEILQKKVIQKHHEYNELTEQLSVLLEERYPERKRDRIKDSLYEAYEQSGRALDEIVDLIKHADEWI